LNGWSPGFWKFCGYDGEYLLFLDESFHPSYARVCIATGEVKLGSA
jgi:hypothetical protein